LHIPGSHLHKLDLSSNALPEDIFATSTGESGKFDLSANTLKDIDVEYVCSTN